MFTPTFHVGDVRVTLTRHLDFNKVLNFYFPSSTCTFNVTTTLCDKSTWNHNINTEEERRGPLDVPRPSSRGVGSVVSDVTVCTTTLSVYVMRRPVKIGYNHSFECI